MAHANQIMDKTGIPRRMNMKTDIAAGNIATNGGLSMETLNGRHGIGQDKPVFVHKLLCQDTVEERIHQMQQEKAKLAAGLLADADISQKLSPEMVRALLE